MTLLAEAASEDRGADINMKLLSVPLAPWGYLTRKITQSYGGNQVFSKLLRRFCQARRKFIGRDGVIKFVRNLNEHLLSSASTFIGHVYRHSYHL